MKKKVLRCGFSWYFLALYLSVHLITCPWCSQSAINLLMRTNFSWANNCHGFLSPVNFIIIINKRCLKRSLLRVMEVYYYSKVNFQFKRLFYNGCKEKIWFLVTNNIICPYSQTTKAHKTNSYEKFERENDIRCFRWWFSCSIDNVKRNHMVFGI